MKIHPVGAELYDADGRTDRHEEGNRSYFLFMLTRLIMTVTKYISKEWHCKDKTDEDNLH